MNTFRKIFIDSEISKEVEKRISGKIDKSEPIYTQSRKTRIDIPFIDMTFQVHNGKKYFPVFITEEKVGYCLGDFVLTRKNGNEKLRNKKSTATNIKPKK